METRISSGTCGIIYQFNLKKGITINDYVGWKQFSSIQSLTGRKRGLKGQIKKLQNDFLDTTLSQTQKGREIIRQYYNFSPVLVEAMKADEGFKNEVRDVIDEALMIIR